MKILRSVVLKTVKEEKTYKVGSVDFNFENFQIKTEKDIFIL